RNRQHPSPTGTQESFYTAGVLVRADGADHRQGEVATIRLNAHRPSGEAHPVRITAFAFKARKPDALADACTSTGALPVPIRVHRTADSVGIGFFRALAPPHLPGLGIDAHVALDGVPAFPQHPKGRLRCCDTSSV